MPNPFLVLRKDDEWIGYRRNCRISSRYGRDGIVLHAPKPRFGRLFQGRWKTAVVGGVTVDIRHDVFVDHVHERSGDVVRRRHDLSRHFRRHSDIGAGDR